MVGMVGVVVVLPSTIKGGQILLALRQRLLERLVAGEWAGRLTLTMSRREVKHLFSTMSSVSEGPRGSAHKVPRCTCGLMPANVSFWMASLAQRADSMASWGEGSIECSTGSVILTRL